MQGRCPCAQRPTRIAPEVVDLHLREIDLGERHRATFPCGLRLVVHGVDEDAHPLIPRPVRVDGATRLECGLDLHAFGSGLHGVVPVRTFNQQIGVAGSRIQLPQMRSIVAFVLQSISLNFRTK